ncbi:MAG: cyclic nucleotide-binding domain-containing protein [Candidatus Eremiobacterota bacterium]
MKEHNIMEKLKKSQIFHILTEESLKTLSGFVTEEFYKAGEHIYKAGDYGDCMYIVTSGEGSVHKAIGKGKYRSFSYIKHDGYVGVMSLFRNKTRFADFTAITDMELIKLKKEDLDKFLAEDSKGGLLLLNQAINVLAEKLRETEKEMFIISEIGEITSTADSEEDIFNKAFSLALMNMDGTISGILAMYNEYTDEFEIKNHECLSVSAIGDGYLSKNEPLIKIIMESHQIYEGNLAEERWLKRGILGEGHSLIVKPVCICNKFLGFLAFCTYDRDFTSSEKNLISTIGDQLGIALGNIHLRKEIKNMKRLYGGRLRVCDMCKKKYKK